MYPEEYIKMDDLKPGYLYKIKARNAHYGIWIPERQSFAISRIKFGNNYVFEEHHWDCEAFATAAPLREIEKSPFKAEDIHMVEDAKHFWYQDEEKILEYLNKFEKEFEEERKKNYPSEERLEKARKSYEDAGVEVPKALQRK